MYILFYMLNMNLLVKNTDMNDKNQCLIRCTILMCSFHSQFIVLLTERGRRGGGGGGGTKGGGGEG